MQDVGPLLSMFLSWQTLILAIAIATSTSAIKTLIDFAVGGTEKRKKMPLFKEVIIPGTAGVLGILYGAFLPLQPDELIEYVKTYGVSMHAVGGAYGLGVSLFADWLYQRVRARLEALNKD